MSTALWIFGGLGLGAVGYVVSELIARFYLARFGGYYPLAPYTRQRFELDSEALPSLEPVVRWRVNKDGERGDEYDPEKARGLLLGGSCVEGYYLDQESTVAVQLQEQLEGYFDGRSLHMGSVARSRISCAQIREMLSRSLHRFGQLDCAVIMVGASDMLRWLELGGPDEGWHDPAIDGHIFGQYPGGDFGWHPQRSALRSLVARAKRRYFPPEERRSGVGRRLMDLRLQRAGAKSMIDHVEDPTPMYARYRLELGELIDDLKRVSARVIVAHQPWYKSELAPDEERWMWNFGNGELYGGQVDTYYTHRLIRELMQGVSDVTADVAQARGVESVNVPELLEANLETYYDFMHFTPKGAAEVARLIAEALRTGPRRRPQA